jgi:hypothetical protein
MTTRTQLRSVSLLTTLLLAVVAAHPTLAQESLDPSGGYASEIGELSVLRGNDTLAFSYSAVFGPAAHTCDGAGVARQVADGRWEYVDGDATVAFLLAKDGFRLEVVAGVAPFCGAGWGGDVLPAASRTAPTPCVASAERAYFHTVASSSPEARKAYVVRGDRVETLPVQNLEIGGFLLARFVGAKSTTVGLIRSADLTCPAR